MRAIKYLSKKNVKKNSISEIKNEIWIMKKLDHPNIIRIYEVYEDDDYFYIC